LKNPGAARARAMQASELAHSVDIDDLAAELDQFLIDAYAQNYFAPNHFVPKSERPKWCFKVKLSDYDKAIDFFRTYRNLVKSSIRHGRRRESCAFIWCSTENRNPKKMIRSAT
jgi:hypothetical protein